MMIHVWKHWFWITHFSLLALLLIGLASEAAFISESPTYLSRRERHDDDVDDTINGANSDLTFTSYPVKKFHAKHTDPKKYKVFTKLDRLKMPSTNNTTTTLPSTSTSTMHLDFINDTVTYEQETTTSFSFVEETEAVTDFVENSSSSIISSGSSSSLQPVTSHTEAFNRRVANDAPGENSDLDAGAITGIALSIVVVSGLLGAISFVLYRRRYLNKPQVLNDKSSNLDSSGYIDDTSFKENSEEMYSLDNDSFLNSLEAMTIQNYWTESVKHTKL